MAFDGKIAISMVTLSGKADAQKIRGGQNRNGSTWGAPLYEQALRFHGKGQPGLSARICFCGEEKGTSDDAKILCETGE